MNLSYLFGVRHVELERTCQDGQSHLRQTHRNKRPAQQVTQRVQLNVLDVQRLVQLEGGTAVS